MVPHDPIPTKCSCGGSPEFWFQKDGEEAWKCGAKCGQVWLRYIDSLGG